MPNGNNTKPLLPAPHPQELHTRLEQHSKRTDAFLKEARWVFNTPRPGKLEDAVSDETINCLCCKADLIDAEAAGLELAVRLNEVVITGRNDNE